MREISYELAMKRHASERVAATERPATGRRARLHEIIFEADTRAGRLFDLALIWLILLSVATVILESVRQRQRAIWRSALRTRMVVHPPVYC